MKVRQLISATCTVLVSLLVIGQALQSLGLAASDSKAAKQAQKTRKPIRRVPSKS
jgi:hypothetical protein